MARRGGVTGHRRSARAYARLASFTAGARVGVVAHRPVGHGDAGSGRRRTCVAPRTRVPRVLPDAVRTAGLGLRAVALRGGGQARGAGARVANRRASRSRVLPLTGWIAGLGLQLLALLEGWNTNATRSGAANSRAW